MSPNFEDLGKVSDGSAADIVNTMQIPANVHVDLRGMVHGMNESFRSFAIGLLLSFCCFI